MLHTTIPTRLLPSSGALYRDFTSETSAPIHRWLPQYRASSPAWKEARSRAARSDPTLLSALRAANQALGVDPSVISRLDGLADATVRAVVTGQQPGMLGGPLMILYKAASAIALSREIEARWKQACVPILWLGSEDDDFAEIRELSLIASDLSRLDVSVDATVYRPGLRVGDIAPSAARSLWEAVAKLLPAGSSAERAGEIAARARDFADGAALSIVAATGGRIAVVDGREPALRPAARELLLGFFDSEPRLRDAIEAGGRALEAEGYHAQLHASADSGLFVMRDGTRQRIPADRRLAAREEFERDIVRVSPGVAARNLVQDALFAPLAVVLGPAEIAYRAQMVDVYHEMKVAMPVVVPRLSATYVPDAVREMMETLSLDFAALALDPPAVAHAARERAEDAAFKDAARRVESAFAREVQAFASLAGGRLDDRARERLDRRFQDIRQRLAQTLQSAVEQDVQGAASRWPFLSRFQEMFRKDAVTQERFLSLWVPFLFRGDAAAGVIDAVATAAVRDALDARTWHGVYSV